MTNPPADFPSRYLPRRELGRGAMGVVYEALDTELNRPVAVKMMHPEMLGFRELAERFRREARAAAALRHPNVVTIHDFGAQQGLHAYLVMELLDGLTLRDEIRRSGPLAPDRVLEILHGIGSALEAAHQLRLVHRDVKPENIFLASAGGSQVPKILDFGVVKSLTSAGDTVAPDATTPGQVVGTLRYMSPEQWCGEAPSPVWDLWALAIVAYEMLTGGHPFPTVTAHREMLRGEIKFKPVEAGPESDDWNRFFAGALAAEISQRPASAGEFVSRLPKSASARIPDQATLRIDRRVPDPDLAVPRPEPGSEPVPGARVETRWRPGRRLLLAVFAALMVAASSALYFFAGGARRLDSLAILPFTNASGDSGMDYLSDGISENLINTVSQLPEITVTSRSSAFRYKSADVDPKTVGRKLGVGTVLLGRVLRRGDQLLVSVELVDTRNGRQLWGQRYDRKLADIFQVQEDISREIAGALRLRLTSAQRNRLARPPTVVVEAHEFYLKGRYYWNKRSQDGLRKGIEHFKQAIDRDPAYALAYAGLADCYALQAGLIPPAEVYPIARAAATRALELDETLAEPHASLAFVKLMFDWDWAGAERECQRALQLNPNYATAHSVYSRHLSAMGRFDEALREIARAQQLDPLSPAIRSAFATTYYHARRYDEAVLKFTATLGLEPQFSPARAGLALVYAEKGRLQEAMAVFQEALKANPADTGVLAEIGRLYGMAGRTDEAKNTIAELSRMSQRRYVSPYFIAVPYLGIGDKNQAFEWLEKACQDRSWPMVYLNVEPKFDPLRSDPRFQGLLKRVGLLKQ
jgi:serine/threonine-protein kinase